MPTTKKTTSAPARKTTAKRVAKPNGKLPVHREVYLAGLGLVDLVMEKAAQFGKFEKDLVARGERRRHKLNAKARSVRKETERQVREVRDAVEEGYHKVIDKAGLGQAA